MLVIILVSCSDGLSFRVTNGCSSEINVSLARYEERRAFLRIEPGDQKSWAMGQDLETLYVSSSDPEQEAVRLAFSLEESAWRQLGSGDDFDIRIDGERCALFGSSSAP